MTTILPDFGNPSVGITKKLTGVTFDGAVDKVEAALKEHGFGVLMRIDVQAIMEKKLNADYARPYVILGACNPKFAHMVLQEMPSIGLFLPCNVCVKENEDGGVIVSTVSPDFMFA